MEPVALTTDAIKNLSGRERIFIDSFVEMLGRDEALAEKVFAFIITKNTDEGFKSDLQNLSSEGKRQACVEYVIIGLISGSIKVKELTQLTQEYTKHKPLITGDYHSS